ncbi:RNA dependent RNA polymerase [Picobirnavirus Equ1]|nr:RNA dependent RNA polymerase [Picobirnavirus Equ1]
MRQALPKELRDVISSNNNLSRYLLSLSKEQAFTDRSWLYEDREPDDVLQAWKEHLAVLENGNTFEREIFQFDTSQEKKWGPQGGHEAFEEIYQSIVAPQFEDSPVPKAFTSELWNQAKAETVAMFKRAGIRALRPAAYTSVIDNMRARDTLESNSGWPSFARRNVEDVKQQAIQDAENGKWKTYPAIALFRRYNNKTRLVWMYPMSVNLVEASFFQPLQTAILKTHLAKEFFAPWVGFEQVRVRVTEEYQSGRFVSASDFSATDQHFRLSTSLEVYDVLAELFMPQYREPLKESIQCMHNIPLVISPTEYIVGEHGVASGSNWTNFIETVFDFILSNYVELLSSNSQEVHYWSGLYGIGDDMSWFCNKYDPKFSEWLSDVGQSVGQEINAEKVTNDPDKVKTLQRLFQRGYRRPDGLLRGVYSTIRALKSSVYPEKFHNPKLWSSDMFCARQFMILENCVDHPLFEDFVKFVCAGQKDLIPFAHKTRAQLDEINRKTKLLPGLNTTYNQERRESSLADFASIRIARNL